jgi:hypothetical protein
VTSLRPRKCPALGCVGRDGSKIRDAKYQIRTYRLFFGRRHHTFYDPTRMNE